MSEWSPSEKKELLDELKEIRETLEKILGNFDDVIADRANYRVLRVVSEE